jgi:DNA-binding SARP family transcriptional activator/TolB-like protein
LALLALLASAGGQPVSRDKLIALLWPESSPDSARHSLADSVYVLGRELGASPVAAVGNGVRLDPAVVSSDLAAFEEALGSGDLERAVGLYGGPFLEGLHIREAFEFEEWVIQERERLERAVCQALERLARAVMARGRPKEAATWLRKLVEHDPYNGRAVAGLMGALAASGDLAGALQQVGSHAVRMRQELDADPDPAVLEMERTLRARRTEEALPTGVTGDGEPSFPAIVRAFPIVLGRARLLAIVGMGIVLLGVIAALLRDRSGMGTGQAAAIGAAPGIAVMPFQVADPNMAVWREGLIDLLTANLDGVGGLRAIDSRTVLAQWHEGVSEGQVPDLRTILKIARDAGGSYAVVGSAVTIGPNVRLLAEVYELARDRAIGTARAEGSPDSLYTLVDRLSIDVLRAILKEDADRLPGVPNLANVTTASIPALKAYLEGETLYRRAEFENAGTAYHRAVAADSTFALAWLKLAWAEWWFLNNLEIIDEIDRALELSNRLSQRETMVAKATRVFLLFDRFRTRELVQELLNFYPDDSELWFLLAMTFGDQFNEPDVPGDPADGERALLRAVELDPTFAPYRINLLYRSFWEADREQVAERLEALAALAGEEDETVKAGRLAYTLAWGDSAGRSRAWTAVDTLDAEFLQLTGELLNNGRFLSINEALQRQAQTGLVAARWCGNSSICLWMILFWEGKFQEGIRLVDHPGVSPLLRRYLAYDLHFLDVALPESLERDLAFQAVETDTFSWLVAGAYAADRGRWAEHAAAVQAFRTVAREVGRDSIDSRAFGGAANVLEGYGLWRRGRAREALPLLIAGQRDMVGQSPAGVAVNIFARRWIGLLLLELGRPAEAVPYLQTLWPGSIIRDPYAAYEMGRAYAELGENRKAVVAYEEALAAWRDADPILRPRIEAARREVARLGGAGE